jgi:hypothetical protein
MQIAKFKLRIADSEINNLHFAICILQSPCVLCAALVLLALSGSPSHGDTFELVNGGRIEGRLLETTKGEQPQYVIELHRGGRLTVARSDVAKIDAASASDIEYQKLARSSPDTVEAHWKLAEWCRERKMTDKMRQHQSRIVELEPNHEKARAALGFRQKNGQWVTRDDVMAARGMVLYDGRYVTPQHVELMERQKGEKVTQADWANRIERLRRRLTGRQPERAAQAHAEIQQTRDPAAADAIAALLRREDVPELRQLWVEVAGQIDHKATVDALINVSLNDPDPELRIQSLEHLIESGRTGLVGPYIRALRNRDNEIVNRAGAALGQIGDHDAIAPLIDALTTKHTLKISDVDPDQHAYSFSTDGAFSFGGSGPQVVTRELRNPAVLNSLVALAGGTTFDYDKEQWRRWLAAQAKVNAVDVRRDE